MQELCQGQLLVGRHGLQLMMAVSMGHKKKEREKTVKTLFVVGGKEKAGAKKKGIRGGKQRILCF